MALFVAVALGLAMPSALFAADDAAPAKPSAPGAEMAQAVSEVTGVAISPLLGASAVGVWKYYHTAGAAEKAKLPWFAQPWFWGPALVIVTLCALKDVFGIAVPSAFKKPFDVVEAIGHKAGGLIAAGAFVPLVVTVFKEGGTPVPASLQMGGNHGFLAVAHMNWLYNGISVPVMLAAFAVVFLASNAINVLILLSPFGLVDAVLKGIRLFILCTVTATALLNPWVGAIWAAILIFISYFIAGWSLRLSHFGTGFIWDLCTFRQKRFVPDKVANKVYLGRKTGDVPIRTYGKLIRNAQGGLEFCHRPWLILPQKKLKLPSGQYAVGKGLLYSEIMRVEGGSAQTVFLLPPRYRSHEEQLSNVYGFLGVRHVGLRATFGWLKERIGLGNRADAIPA